MKAANRGGVGMELGETLEVRMFLQRLALMMIMKVCALKNWKIKRYEPQRQEALEIGLAVPSGLTGG